MRFHHCSILFSGLLALSCTSPQPPRTGSCQLTAGSSAQDWDYALTSCASQLNAEPFSADSLDGKPTKDVDVLFVIDNSTSMSPKQKALAESIPRFIQKLESFGIDYHIGIVTTDVGSLPPPGNKFPGVGEFDLRCGTLKGDDGMLQRQACTSRTVGWTVLDHKISAFALADCRSMCPDPSFVPSGGAGYISKVGGVTNVPVSIDSMTGKDVGPQRAFQCMAMVGDAGCGVESPFESAKRALDGHNAANAGFLRPRALLAVIFLTDEDDCSVQLSRRTENDPRQMSCDPHAANSPGCFNLDYRCMARSVECDEPVSTIGVKTNCREKDSFLEPVDKYVRFFRALRPTNRLFLSGVWTLPSVEKTRSFEVALETDTTLKTDVLNRAPACVSAKDPNVIGKPQLRLSKFASKFRGTPQISICDTDRYDDALDRIATAMTVTLQSNCTSELPQLKDGQPVCLVGDVDQSTPSAVPQSPFPRCGTSCCQAWAQASTPSASDPAIVAACQGEAADACYCAVPSQAGACSDAAVAGVWRKPGTTPPEGTVVNFTCVKGGAQ